jgi:cyclopropane-fatty-acyl-phospholipid synthase
VQTLDDAQENKLDLVCRKIGLKKGDRVLDIGCGWGSWAIYAAQKYGASVVGLTISKEQVSLATERARGLPVEIRLQDYRELRGETFDHVISIGMFEHVGVKNYRNFMKIVKSLLKEDGLFLLHSIGQKRSGLSSDPWIDKYIFPNGFLPSVAQIATAANGLFVLEDWHNFGSHYERTLLEWFKNFDAHWPEIREKYGDRFYRMWKFYLLSSAATFRARNNFLWQIVFSPNGVVGGYQSVR